MWRFFPAVRREHSSLSATDAKGQIDDVKRLRFSAAPRKANAAQLRACRQRDLILLPIRSREFKRGFSNARSTNGSRAVPALSRTSRRLYGAQAPSRACCGVFGAGG